MAGVQIQYTIPRLDEWAARFKEAPVKTVTALTMALEKSAVLVEGRARANAPARTGLLRGSIQHKVDGLTATIYTKKKYAEYVEMGTGIYGPDKHIIRASDYGKKVFATKVNPGFGVKNAAGYYVIGPQFKGQQANPFMKKAYYETKSEVRAIFWQAGQQLLRELGGK